MSLSRENNFDLIRLIAALQVMVYHSLTHFQVQANWAEPLKQVVYLLPGVPIFFTISGFLIYQSLERNRHGLKKYFVNRFLRLYPALWACLAFTILLITLSGHLNWEVIFTQRFLLWFTAQLSFFQFYPLEDFRTWGVGHPNGSLWSISVEIQFYLLLPVLFYLLFDKKYALRTKNIVLFILMAISIAFNYYQQQMVAEHKTIGSLMGVFILHYLYFFCSGIILYLNFERLKKFLVGKGWIWIGLFILYTVIFHNWLNYFENVYETSLAGIIGESLLAIATISAAYSKISLSSKILSGNDLSYGIYIYHMPVINYFYTQTKYITPLKFVSILAAIVVIAFFSWRIIEKNVLKLKTKINL